MKHTLAILLLSIAIPARSAWWLEWDAAPTVEQVTIYRVWYAPLALARLNQFVPIAKDFTSPIAALPTNLTPGTTYAFRVTAVNANGESDPSEYVTFTAAGGTSRPSKLGIPRIVEKP